MPDDLHTLLGQKENKILFVGIGNLLKSDDGIGVYISRNIKESDNISALTVEVSIENYIGKINSLHPDILILIDCMELGGKAGSYTLLDINQVQDLTFNTHNISLRRLKDFFPMKVFILGIQPERIDFGENISYLVRENADKILKQINNRR